MVLRKNIWERVIIYWPNGETLSETTRKVTDNLLRVQPAKDKNILIKKPVFSETLLHAQNTTRDDLQMHGYNKGQLWQMKINPFGDIVKYKEGPAVDEEIYIGYKTFVRESCRQKHCSPKELEEKYLPTEEKLTLLAGPQKQEGVPPSEEYKTFYEKYIQVKKNPGYFMPQGEKLGRVGERLFIRVAWGKSAEFTEEWREITEGWKSYGFAGRLFE